jgi:hypothetical protein
MWDPITYPSWKLVKLVNHVDDQLPNPDRFCIESIPDYLYDIALFLTTGKAPKDYFANKKRHLVIREADYHLISWKVAQDGFG